MALPARAGTIGALTAAALLAGASGAAASPTAQAAAGSAAADDVITVAHRGASAYAPENTLPAVELGAEMKADLVEIDVQATADGELVVIHDTTLARTTDVEQKFPDRAPWNVGDFTFEEIRTLDAGSWFGEEYAGTQIPTLQEVLDALDGRAGLLLEAKAPALYPGIEQTIAEELDGEGWLRAGAASGRLVVQSFDWGFMEAFNALAPEVPAGLLGDPPGDDAALAELATWADQVNPSHTRVTGEVVERIHDAGLEIMPYTVDDADRMRELVELGVDGVITNRPDVLIDVLEEDRPGRGRPDAA
ncbi:glycerophosphodiester phosphodiesterase [Georgenia sp. AZ-5]|uniref:glycerophosphodiester phosphodiesterase n=1 Tax=Georgenia sp. AZ-5 TaxID=3367526 RepID=UPI003754A55D